MEILEKYDNKRQEKYYQIVIEKGLDSGIDENLVIFESSSHQDTLNFIISLRNSFTIS